MVVPDTIFFLIPLKQMWLNCRRFYRQYTVIIFLAFPFVQSINACAQGKLFIIGGGSRTPSMIARMLDEAGVRQTGNIVILPMASAEQDSAIWYAKKQFVENGIERIHGILLQKGELPGKTELELLASASLIYITGGDQTRFMDIIRETGIEEKVHLAYTNGAVVAGTSAGAAVMSKHMLTGNEKKYPQYTETSRTIESENIELNDGLGFLQNVIVDQHFIKRSRHNRLISVVIENADYMGVGIDEATAILVKDGEAEVIGESQVVVYTNPRKSMIKKDNKLGARKLELNVYLPGEKFRLPKGKK